MTDNDRSTSMPAIESRFPPTHPTITPALILNSAYRSSLRRSRFSAAVQRYLLLTRRKDQMPPRDRDLHAVARLATPPHSHLAAPGLGDHPSVHLEWRMMQAHDPLAFKRVENDIVEWVVTVASAEPGLTATMEGHWASMPEGMPVEVSVETQRDEWCETESDGLAGMEALEAKKARAWLFFRKNVELIATVALAEKEVRTAEDEGRERSGMTVYQRLAGEMETDVELVGICETVATGVARDEDRERLLSYLPWSPLREPGRTPYVE